MSALGDLLVKHHACSEAVEWADAYPDLRAAWGACERADWMLWLAGKLRADHRSLVLIGCDCARTVLVLVPDGDDRPRLAIETAERWADGKATAAECSYAVADAVAVAAHAAHAAHAAYAYAADAAAAYAADDAAAASAYATATARCADLVRARIDADTICSLAMKPK